MSRTSDVLLILFAVCCLFYSCKNSDKNKKDVTVIDNTEVPQVSETDFTYTTDSASDEVAVIVIRPDGESEYMVDNINKIFQKKPSGLEYKYIISGKSKKYPRIGDVVHITMDYKTEKDSVIFRSSEIDEDFKMRLTPPSHSGGSIEEAFSMLSEGDSAIFKIDAVNFLTKTQGLAFLPDYVNPGDKLIFNIKMNKIIDGSEYVKQNADIYTYYIDHEKSLIERLVMELNFPRTITGSGLNIINLDKGSGRKVKDGDVVTIDYTASFIDGTVFDSTIERNSPFRFVLGNNEVIEGLEEGVKSMNTGDHSIFIIPFRLAYGDTKHGIVPPFSTLIFEVELLDAK